MSHRVLGALMMTLAVGSCSAGRNDSRTIEVGGQRVRTSELTTALAGLCIASRRAGDPALARTVFYDRAHADLHVIARALEEVDRPMAGRLLEAKQRVEADLGSDGRITLRPDLERLISVTRAALGRLSVRRPAC